MSIQHSIGRVKRSLGGGMDRVAYFSKKYDCVIKLVGSGGDTSQSQNERILFEKMTEKEKEVFPILEVVDSSRGIAIIMKRAIVLRDYLDKNFPNRWFSSDYNLRHALYKIDSDFTHFTANDYKIIRQSGLSVQSVKNVMKFKRKYNLYDLHLGNLGIIGNNLVIIDAGIEDA